MCLSSLHQLRLLLMQSLIVVTSINTTDFNNEFRYVPTNADVAGLMARTTLRLSLGSHQRVSKEALSIMQLNLHTTHPSHREICSIHRESTQLSLSLVLEQCSSVIRLVLHTLPRSIESMFAASSLQLNKH